MKDSTSFLVSGLLCQVFVIAFSFVSDSIVPMAMCSALGIILLGVGFKLICEDK